MSRIGIFFAEGYEEVEALTVVDLARRAGLEIDMISVTGGREVTGSHGITVKWTRYFPKLISAGWTCWCSRAGCRGLRTWRTVRN